MSEAARIYIDSGSFIDAVRIEVGQTLPSERELDVWFFKKLLEANRDREVEIFTSTLTIAECTHIGDPDISNGVKSAFARLLTSGQYVRLVQPDPFIAEDARDLRWVHGINTRGADAIHLASALSRKCQEFLSTDKRLERVSRHQGILMKLGLVVRSGRETLCLPSKYRQLGLDDEKAAH